MNSIAGSNEYQLLEKEYQRIINDLIDRAVSPPLKEYQDAIIQRVAKLKEELTDSIPSEDRIKEHVVADLQRFISGMDKSIRTLEDNLTDQGNTLLDGTNASINNLKKGLADLHQLVHEGTERLDEANEALHQKVGGIENHLLKLSEATDLELKGLMSYLGNLQNNLTDKFTEIACSYDQQNKDSEEQQQTLLLQMVQLDEHIITLKKELSDAITQDITKLKEELTEEIPSEERIKEYIAAHFKCITDSLNESIPKLEDSLVNQGNATMEIQTLINQMNNELADLHKFEYTSSERLGEADKALQQEIGGVKSHLQKLLEETSNELKGLTSHVSTLQKNLVDILRGMAGSYDQQSQKCEEQQQRLFRQMSQMEESTLTLDKGLQDSLLATKGEFEAIAFRLKSDIVQHVDQKAAVFRKNIIISCIILTLFLLTFFGVVIHKIG